MVGRRNGHNDASRASQQAVERICDVARGDRSRTNGETKLLESPSVCPIEFEVLLLDRCSAPLQVAVADGAVKVDGCFGDALETIQIERSFVHRIGGRAGKISPPRNEIGV